MQTYPFRLGTTSYIIPDDILPNARFLADKVDDIELVLFEVDDGPNNLPTPQTLKLTIRASDPGSSATGSRHAGSSLESFVRRASCRSAFSALSSASRKRASALSTPPASARPDQGFRR